MKRILKTRPYQILILIALLIVAQVLFAQDQVSLTTDTPISLELTSSTDTTTIQYQATTNQTIILQAMSDLAHPSLQILKDGVEIARYRPSGQTSPSITLPAYLTAGTYTIRVSALNTFDNSARILLGVMGHSESVSQSLSYGQTVQGTILSDSPFALYQFQGVFEQSQVIANFTPVGANLRIFKIESEETWLNLNSASIGGRVYLPQTEGQFQIAVISDVTQPVSYTLCYVSISAGCGEGTATQPQQPTQPSTCVAIPLLAGGANIRQSASTDAPIIGALAGDQSVPITGINPEGTWYQVMFNGQVGWASATAVRADGDCAGLPSTVPPAIPTAVPMPSAIPTGESDPSGNGDTGNNGDPTFIVTAVFVPFPTAEPTGVNIPSGALDPRATITGGVSALRACRFTLPDRRNIFSGVTNMEHVVHQGVMGETFTVLGKHSGYDFWYKLDLGNNVVGWVMHDLPISSGGFFTGNCDNIPSITS